MTCTIIGGGFGLYGYMPALIQNGEKVFLPSRYRELLKARKDISQYESEIIWTPTMEEGLRKAQSVIIAVPPIMQAAAAVKIIKNHPQITDFFLEKPLANDPPTARALLDELERNSKRIAAGFVFLYCPWAKLTVEAARLSLPVKILWSFNAHHFTHKLFNWKRQHTQGGGALRFYGIQLIALLSSLGYSRVKNSTLEMVGDDVTRWVASFEGDGLADCSIDINTSSESKLFYISAGDTPLIQMLDPFEVNQNTTTEMDRRVALLSKIIAVGTTPNYQLFRSINALWQSVEQRVSNNCVKLVVDGV